MLKRRAALLLAWALMAAGAGCATPAKLVPPSVDVTGFWTGTAMNWLGTGSTRCR